MTTSPPTDERVAIPCLYAKSFRVFDKKAHRKSVPMGTSIWSVVIDGTTYEYPFDAASFDGETLYLRRDLAERDGHVK